MVRAKPIVYAAQDSVTEGNQGQERDQHDGDVEGEATSVNRSTGNRAKQIFLFMFGVLDRKSVV